MVPAASPQQGSGPLSLSLYMYTYAMMGNPENK